MENATRSIAGDEGLPLSREMALRLGVSNWTSNVTYESPVALMDQVLGNTNALQQSALWTKSQVWYRPYPTTLSVIVLLHVILLHQWNRKRGSKCLASYQQIVRQKQFYKAVLAVLSHPPVSRRRRRLRQRSLASEGQGLAGELGNATSPSADPIWLQRMWNWARPFTEGSLSGMPLLAYICHLLWSCRALEPMHSSWGYFRSLVALSALSLGLELRLTHNLLSRLPANAAQFGSIQPEFGKLGQTRKILLHKPLGTFTALVHALVLWFQITFPFVSLPVIPLIPTSWLLPQGVSCFFCSAVLVWLSWKHEVAILSFASGVAVGFLYAVFGLSFLGTYYWGTCLLLWIGAAIMLSLRVGTDYVSWDARGVIYQDGEPVPASLLGDIDTTVQETEQDDDSTDDGIDDDENSMIDLENQSEIRGRVPIIALGDDEEEPLLIGSSIATSNSVRTNGVNTLTRRAGGGPQQ